MPFFKTTDRNLTFYDPGLLLAAHKDSKTRKSKVQ